MTAAVLGPLLAADPGRPRLTVYGTAGARTELSTASLANWSAKVAGLLTDELGIRPGDRVAVLLPTGWQTAPVLFGAWWAGALVTDADDPDAVAAFVPDGGDAAADEVFVVSGHPLGAPSRQVQAHQRDFTGAVLSQADRFSPGAAVGEQDPVLVAGGTAVGLAALLGAVAAASTALAGTGGDHVPRLLSAVDWTLDGEPAGSGLVRGLLAPLAAGGSVAQATGEVGPGELVRVAAAERATVTLGVTVPGLTRLDA